MKNPKILNVLIKGASYELPTYVVGEDGLQDAQGIVINFVKGDKSNPETYRQDGVITESIIQLAKEFMETVNVGDLACRENAMVITKLDEALMWINKRAEDRKLRGVQGTYQK